MTEIRPVAHIENDYVEKFGIPRQAGLAKAPLSCIVFEPDFRDPEALRGLEDYSHIWLIWEFSQSKREDWSPTVRPPRLGGNTRMGVFATRSPFRPNPIGLSCVEIARIDLHTDKGPLIFVRGADLMDQTPIYDIKPYIPYADAHPEAKEGFTATTPRHTLQVEIDEEWYQIFGWTFCEEVREILRQDPRPAYQNDPDRVYGMKYGNCDIRFRVVQNKAIVIEIERSE